MIKGNKLYRELLHFKLIDKCDYLTGKEVKPSDQILVCKKRKMECTSSSQELTNPTKPDLEQDKKLLEVVKKINLLQKKLKKILKYDNLRKI